MTKPRHDSTWQRFLEWCSKADRYPWVPWGKDKSRTKS